MPSNPTAEKTKRHQELLAEVSETLIKTDGFLTEAVPRVAQLLAENLHAQCVCIFFRRKVTKELQRVALAINEAGRARNLHGNERFDWDRTYPRGSRTLLYETYKGQLGTINYGRDELSGGEVNQEIVTRFEDCLKSPFEHLIIVRMYIGDKQLGAIRVINHLDPTNGFATSRTRFSKEQDVAVVSSVGAMLALAYANYRKTGKIFGLGKLADDVVQAKTEQAAVQACLKNLSSDETGFPLAMWREYKSDGSSEVTWHHSPEEIPVPDGLPLAPGQGLQIAGPPQPVAITDKNFHYNDWAKKHELGGLYALKIPYLGGLRALIVFADDPKEFDRLSRTLIEINRDTLANTLRRIPSFGTTARIVGDSSPMKLLKSELRQVASTDSTVLILGERGAGKEETALALHELSGRTGRFKTVNCAALPQQLLESQLFGHEKGAFSGADRMFRGHFEQANHGTIFLDEIGDMTLETQTKVLRVLQNRQVERLGSEEEPIAIDTRVIAATNKDLDEMKRKGTFREDLYDRLNVIRITVPPLRKHSEDIPELAQYLLGRLRETLKGKEVRDISRDAVESLQKYSWPGNVRELGNVIERAAIYASGETITLEDIRQAFRAAGISEQDREDRAPDAVPLKEFLARLMRQARTSGATLDKADLERQRDAYCKQVVEECFDNKTTAKKVLGISLPTLRKYLGENKIAAVARPESSGTLRGRPRSS